MNVLRVSECRCVRICVWCGSSLMTTMMCTHCRISKSQSCWLCKVWSFLSNNLLLSPNWAIKNSISFFHSFALNKLYIARKVLHSFSLRKKRKCIEEIIWQFLPCFGGDKATDKQRTYFFRQTIPIAVKTLEFDQIKKKKSNKIVFQFEQIISKGT